MNQFVKSELLKIIAANRVELQPDNNTYKITDNAGQELMIVNNSHHFNNYSISIRGEKFIDIKVHSTNEFTCRDVRDIISACFNRYMVQLQDTKATAAQSQTLNQQFGAKQREIELAAAKEAMNMTEARMVAKLHEHQK